MKGMVAVITGAAGGIGGELSKVVHRLGGTVVALDRNSTGLEVLQKSLIQERSDGNVVNDKADSKGCQTPSESAKDRVVILPTNHEDLASVKKSSEIIISKFGRIDLLVNNAGLSYTNNRSMVSAHGRDLAFTVNYLSHFLLTELLLKRLSNGGRIVHVTSTFHWMVDGSELLPNGENGVPMAYQSNPQLQSPKHVERSYANTKLAQIWHSRSIAKAHKGARCSSVCACPTWASTGIAGEGARSFLDKYAFAVSDCGPGVTSAINAMLRTDEELGDALDEGRSFVANSKILDYISIVVRGLLTSKFVSKIRGCRDFLAGILSAILLVGQKYTYRDFILQETSPESFEDEEKRDQFYKWSKEEVKTWL
jgi:NAD(P)-dependent dehydrogenase (short-subunit alcohol dehydrogenase family)